MVGTGQPAEIWVDSAAEESVCPQDFGRELGMTKAETAVRLVNASGGRLLRSYIRARPVAQSDP